MVLRKINAQKGKNSYQCEVNIDAPIQKVYEAIAENVRDWWTRDYETELAKIETKFTVRFGETFAIMQNEELTPYKKIVWKCIEQHHVNETLSKTDEWNNTKITFELKDNESGTKLNFLHDGLTPNLECFEICQNGWDYYIKTSLKNYIETGNGYPYKSGEDEAKKILSGSV